LDGGRRRHAQGRVNELRTALQIKEQSPLRRCSCLGDYTIELRSPSGQLVLFSYHYHETALLGCSLWDRDAELLKPDSFLSLLSPHGITERGKKLIAEQRIAENGRALRLEQLGVNRFPPLPAPILQLPRAVRLLSAQALLTQVNDARTATDLREAMELLWTQQVLSTRTSLLPNIHESTWTRLLSHVSDKGPRENLPYLEHARQLAQAQHARHLETPRISGAEPVIISQSNKGPLRSLATDGIDLYSVAGSQLVRISISGEKYGTVLDLPEQDVELSCYGPSLLLTCRSSGLVGRVLVADARLEVVATARNHPRMPMQCRWLPQWIEEAKGTFPLALAQLEGGVSSDNKRVAWLARMNRRAPGAIGDDEFIYYLDHDFDGKAQLRWLRRDGLHFKGVDSMAPIEPGSGTPLLAHDAGHVFWPALDKVMFATKFHMDSGVRATASGPLAAIAPTEQGIYVLVGSTKERMWHVEFAAAGQVTTQRLGSFERQESDLVASVTVGEMMYFVCGQFVYSAGPPRQ
jgi:hypothetical protein